MKGPATRYSIIEYGICLWTATPDGDAEYTAQAFNFYIFPKSGGDIVMQPSSIDFLRCVCVCALHTLHTLHTSHTLHAIYAMYAMYGVYVVYAAHAVYAVYALYAVCSYM